MKKFFSILLAALMLSVLIASPASADSTKNYAGRPLASTSAGSEASNQTKCQMLAYGRVDGKKVIFAANHCFDGKGFNGQTIVDEDGVGYANIVTSQAQCSSTYDLCFMWLKSGKWPTNPHQIYGGVSSGVTKWATIGTVRGDSKFSCTNMSGMTGAAVWEYQQNLQTSTALPDGGVFDHKASNCGLYTTAIPYDATYRHSSSPLMDRNNITGDIIGVGSSHDGANLIYGNVYEGMRQMHNYWVARGTYVGVKFCTTAAC